MKKLALLLTSALLLLASVLLLSSCGVINLLMASYEYCEHDWKSATCTTPRTCYICGTTEGESLGHNSEWGEWDVDYEKSINAQELYCIRCDSIIETKSEPIVTFVEDDHFTIYASAFADRFENSSKSLNDINFYIKSEYNIYNFYDEDNTIFYRIQDRNDDYRDIGMISFSKPNGKTVAVMNNYTSNCIGCITILIEDSYDVSAVVYSAILAIDPDIGYIEAGEIGQTIVDNIAINIGDTNEEDFQGLDYNGINYLLFRDRKYHYLSIAISSST